jgi:tetratricopeptide (TPR) repeat protein
MNQRGTAVISPRLRIAGCCVALVFIPRPAAPQTTPNLSSDHLRASVDPTTATKPELPVLTNEMRGDIYMARKMYREAIDMYQRAPADSAIVQNKIGISFHQMLQFGVARKYYERAIHLDPHYAEAINNEGTIFYAQKSYKKAIVYYKRSLRYSHAVPSVYVNIGAAYFARHDYKHASEYYEDALNLDPDVFEHRGGFGTLMQERSVEELGKFHLYLAKTYAKRGNNDRALIYLRKALEEGIQDRSKLGDIPEFVKLKEQPEFQQLLAENPKPL